ncbi:MAG: class I SAM-dependent methyltransferase family protein [Thermoleophilia bacterium]
MTARRNEAEAVAQRFAALTRELPATSPRAWHYRALHLANRAGGHLSRGLGIGYRQGFDSGAFMDHVYADRPRGRTPLGVALDRRLLARPTCQAFRDIRDLAREAVADAITAHPGPEGPLVMDVAAGPAPYLLTAIAGHPTARAVLCDIDPAALGLAGDTARRLGVDGRVKVYRADAFAVDGLAALAPHPDILLELGLYGIYHDDERIRRHLLDVGRLLRPAQIVCNVQTRNPEIEYIARVWRNAAGRRCVWRLRPHEWIVQWAAAAGYAPARITADRHGIYRVMRFVREDLA